MIVEEDEDASTHSKSGPESGARFDCDFDSAQQDDSLADTTASLILTVVGNLDSHGPDMISTNTQVITDRWRFPVLDASSRTCCGSVVLLSYT